MKAVFSLASKIAPSVIFVDEVSFIEHFSILNLGSVYHVHTHCFPLFSPVNLLCLCCRLTACWAEEKIQGNMRPCVR